MQKKNKKNTFQLAEDFLKNYRNQNKNKKQNKIEVQKNEIQYQIDKEDNDMDIQMRSQSAFQAEQLFGNLVPQQPEGKIVQKSKSQPKLKQKKQQKKTNRNLNNQNQHIKINQTKSILLRGRLNQRKQSMMEQQKSYQQKIQNEARDPKRRSVTFEGILPQIQKKWNDPIQNQKKGKFDKQQQRILSQAVGKFLVTNGISLQQFQALISVGQKSQKFNRKQKIFALLASALPNRSPQSCYKYLKRNFNTLNRKGKWTQQQIDRLKILVQKYGRKWTLISKQLKRSSDNCYDKFRQLGEQNMGQRIKGIWKFREVLQLLNIIQKMTKNKFLNPKVNDQLARQNFHDSKQKQDILNRKYNSKTFIFHSINVLKPYIDSKKFQKIDISRIRWNQIANNLKTKNILDCRNKIIQLLQIFFHSAPKQIDQQVVQYLITKKYQSQQQINWKQWTNKNITPEQAKNRFMILKKMVQGRSVKPFKIIVLQLKDRVLKKKNINNGVKDKKLNLSIREKNEANQEITFNFLK